MDIDSLPESRKIGELDMFHYNFRVMEEKSSCVLNKLFSKGPLMYMKVITQQKNKRCNPSYNQILSCSGF